MAFPQIVSHLSSSTGNVTGVDDVDVTLAPVIDNTNLILVLSSTDDIALLTLYTGLVFVPIQVSGVDVLNNDTVSPFRFHAYARIANGNEDSVVLHHSLTAAESIISDVFIINNWSGDLANIEIALSASGVTSTPDCPALTASWGAADNLFIACEVVDFGGINATAAPAGYTGLISHPHPDAFGGRQSMGFAYKQVNAATEDPGSFTLENTTVTTTMTATIVIKPAQSISISDINTTEIVAQGDIGVVVTGTNLPDGTGQSDFIWSPTDNINDANAVSQAIATYTSSTSVILDTIDFTGTGIAENEIVYCFAVDSAGNSNATGFQITREDITAPSLTLPTVTGKTNVVATLGCTTGEAGDAHLCVYLSSEGTPPTGPEVVAGNYANAVEVQNGQAVTAGAFSFTQTTGITGNTAYSYKIAVVDASGNYNVLTGSFTTLSKTISGTLTGAVSLTGLSASIFSSDDPETYTIVDQVTGISTDASGNFSIDANTGLLAALTDSQTVTIHFANSVDLTKGAIERTTVTVA
jgi:hypothetical protein